MEKPVTQICYGTFHSTGWGFRGYSENMPSVLRESFATWQSHDLTPLLEDAKEQKKRLRRLSFHRLGKHYAFCKSTTFDETDDVGRPLGMSHAFMLDESKAKEILRNPEQLLYFDSFLDSDPFKDEACRQAVESYDFSFPMPTQVPPLPDISPYLLSCVFTLLDTEETLCVVPPEALIEQCGQEWAARLYVVALMRCLPFSLRSKLTFSSMYYPNQSRTALTFSNRVESGCYFDCNAADSRGAFAIKGLSLIRTPFIDACCNNIGRMDANYWTLIDAFVTEGGLDFSDDFDMLGLAYTYHRTLEERASYRDTDISTSLMIAVAVCQAKPSQPIYALTSDLLGLCVEKNISLPAKLCHELDAISNGLPKDHSLRKNNDTYFANSIERADPNTFKMVMALEQDNFIRYCNVLDVWQKHYIDEKSDIILAYFDYCIRAASGKKVWEYVRDAKSKGALSGEAVEAAADKYLDLFKQGAKSFSSFIDFEQQIRALTFGDHTESEFFESYTAKAKRLYWASFNWSTFELQKANEYEKLYVQDSSESGAVQSIVQFNGQMTDKQNYSNDQQKLHDLRQLLTSEQRIKDTSVRDNILRQLRDSAVRKQSQMSLIAFDSWLLLFYLNQKKTVDCPELIRMMESTSLLRKFCGDKNCPMIRSSAFLDALEIRSKLLDEVDKKSRKGNKAFQWNYQQFASALSLNGQVAPTKTGKRGSKKPHGYQEAPYTNSYDLPKRKKKDGGIAYWGNTARSRMADSNSRKTFLLIFLMLLIVGGFIALVVYASQRDKVDDLGSESGAWYTTNSEAETPHEYNPFSLPVDALPSLDNSNVTSETTTEEITTEATTTEVTTAETTTVATTTTTTTTKTTSRPTTAAGPQLSFTSRTLNVGDSLKLEILNVPARNATFEDVSKDTSIIYLDANNGTVTARKPGIAVVNAYNNGKKVDSCRITVR